MSRGLARRFQLDPDEARRAHALGAILFALVGSYTLVKTARDADFLAELPVSVLPYVLVVVGLLTLGATLVFGRLTQRLANWQALAAGAVSCGLSLLVFAWLFRLQARWVTIAFYLWANVYGLILMSQFWAFAASLSDPREARRTFGVIGVGGLLGGLFGGLIAAPLARMWSLSALVMAAAILLIAAVPLLRLSVGQGIVGQPEPEGEQPGEDTPLFSRTYVRWLVLAALCSVMVSALVDYQFKLEIQRRFSDRGQLATYLGMFHSMVNVVALILQLFVARWLMTHLGSAGSVALLPAGLAVGTAFAIALPGLAAATATRLWDQAMGLSIAKVGQEISFFPLEPGLRRRVKSFIETAVERLGEGVAGLLILGIGMFAGATTRTLGIAAGVILVAWVAAWMGVRRGYLVELGRNVRRLSLGHERMRVSLREAGVIREVSRQLQSPYERVVLQSVEMLEENAPDVLDAHLPGLLHHRSTAVRIRTLQWIRAHRPDAPIELVLPLMQDPDPGVRGETLVTWCALRRVGILDRLEQMLRSDDAGLRGAAIRCVTQYVGPSEADRAREVLEDVLRNSPPQDRVCVAEGLGARARSDALFQLLSPLLDDADLRVRRAALRSAGAARRREHVLRLIDALGRKETSRAARAGLAAFGERVVGTLGDYLSDSSVDLALRWEIPYVLSDVGTPEAVNALFRTRDRSDVRLTYRILKASNRIRSASAGIQFPAALVTEDLERDAHEYARALVHHHSGRLESASAAERLFGIALRERMDQALIRVFRRLGLLYPPTDILAAYRGVTSDTAKQRGNAVEYLENALRSEHRSVVLPLVEASEDARLKFVSAHYKLGPMPFADSLAAILQGDDAWLRAVALYVVGTRHERGMEPLVDSNLGMTDPRVRDAARWAHLALAGV